MASTHMGRENKRTRDSTDPSPRRTRVRQRPQGRQRALGLQAEVRRAQGLPAGGTRASAQGPMGLQAEGVMGVGVALCPLMPAQE